MNNVLTKRFITIFWVNKSSLRATLTSELLDIGFNPETDNLEKSLQACVIQKDGKKRIIIEKI